MKVLHVIASVDPRWGGPVEGVLASSRILIACGHEAHVLSLDPPDADFLQNMPVPTFAVGVSGRLHDVLRRKIRLLRFAYTPGLAAWLEEHAEDYDAVIVNGLWNYASSGTWRALRKSGAPYFVFVHGMLDPWFNKTSLVKTSLKRIFWKALERKVLRDARGVLFTCEAERRLARLSFAPYEARELVVGYGTQDIGGDAKAQLAAFHAQAPSVRGRKLILYLSRIHAKKGVDLLIHAFARHAARFPEVDMVIAGPDQNGLQESLEALARDLKIADRICWPGMLSGDAKWGAFRAADVFALPSHQENFGVAIVEALALHTPVLITNKVNIWREIEADGAGLVVNDDIEGVSAGLERMLALSPDERQSMREAGRQSFERRYDVRKASLDLIEALGRELQRRPGASLPI